jgi:hypothetical protein
MEWMSCNCGTKLIGFTSASPGTDGYGRVQTHAQSLGYETITDLVHTPNFEQIPNCKVIFAGLDVSCGAVFGTTNFGNLYPQIKEFLDSGGRLWLQLEWGHPGEAALSCFVDTGIGDFLTAMGTTMNWIGGDRQPDDIAFHPMVPGDAQISQGLPSNQNNNRFGQMSRGSGKVVWESGTHYGAAAGQSVVVAEAIGSGFLFMTGDSNLWGVFIDGEKELIRRLIESGDNEIL